MKIETLNEFIVLTDCKNYSKAADYLFISQSTLTKHIQQLEQELGVNLIDRSNNSFSLTLDGIVFYEYALKIVKLKQDVVARISAPDSLGKISLSIGTGYLSLDEHAILSQAFTSFSTQYPHCSIRTVRFSTFNHCKSLLRNGDITIAILKYSNVSGLSSFINEQSSDYELTPLYYSPLVAILPKGHHLAEKSISILDLANEPFILGAQNTFRHHDCIATCLSSGFEPHIAHTLDTPEATISFVAQGKGISIMTESLAKKAIDDQVHMVYFDPPLIEQTAIISTKNQSPHTMESHFIANILSALKENNVPENTYAAK